MPLGARFLRLDRKRFPQMQSALRDETDQTPLYTNSTQLPVHYSDDIFRELDLQDPLQTRYTGGTVFHAFLGEAVPDPGAVRDFVRTVFQRYRLPYLTLSPTFSICSFRSCTSIPCFSNISAPSNHWNNRTVQ